MTKKGELYRVIFGDDHEEEVEAEGVIEAAKKAKRRRKAREGREVRVQTVRRSCP